MQNFFAKVIDYHLKDCFKVDLYFRELSLGL